MEQAGLFGKYHGALILIDKKEQLSKAAINEFRRDLRFTKRLLETEPKLKIRTPQSLTSLLKGAKKQKRKLKSLKKNRKIWRRRAKFYTWKKKTLFKKLIFKKKAVRTWILRKKYFKNPFLSNLFKKLDVKDFVIFSNSLVEVKKRKIRNEKPVIMKKKFKNFLYFKYFFNKRNNAVNSGRSINLNEIFFFKLKIKNFIKKNFDIKRNCLLEKNLKKQFLKSNVFENKLFFLISHIFLITNFSVIKKLIKKGGFLINGKRVYDPYIILKPLDLITCNFSYIRDEMGILNIRRRFLGERILGFSKSLSSILVSKNSFSFVFLPNKELSTSLRNTKNTFLSTINFLKNY